MSLMLTGEQSNTRSITFIDTEIDPSKGKILDIGAIKEDNNYFHKPSLTDFSQFLKGSEYVCGHNILKHDIKYVGSAVYNAGIDASNIIDTLYLSPLLFPTKPYHALLKDDKLQTDDTNNPLNDSIKSMDLFNDEVAIFWQTDDPLKDIFYLLLGQTTEFSAFFRYVNYKSRATTDAEALIMSKFSDEICSHVDITKIIADHPIELAYCLSLINSFITNKNVHSITPPWVLKNYPEVERIMLLLRSKPCVTGCTYCNKALNIYKGLKTFFKFDTYRTYGGEPLQENAVKAAVNNKSLLAVFPNRRRKINHLSGSGTYEC
ncbi:hypothetical protein LRS05_09380 [Flavobacterium sp. J372]|uniref:hypothetical protein n=1 Tax=Flavobacterium sp. J372 TaxID=2898436 RepID=UPI00215095FE|nr:hypothetical protein [Flavobacterium sp. J372]MCR5862344.1 hypothetical protein [Flavobacterium sp. J372]